MEIVRLIIHVTHTNVPFFDLSPKLMIRSRVNLDASKANLSCEIKRLFYVWFWTIKLAREPVYFLQSPSWPGMCIFIELFFIK